MLFMASLISLAWIACAAGASAIPSDVHHNAKRLSETHPWRLEGLTVFTASRNSSTPSYVGFKFVDVNSGLELQTPCALYTYANGTTSPSRSSQACRNSTVAFDYSKNVINVQRTYIDPSVGPPPFMDLVTAFGHANVVFKGDRTDTCGETQTATLVEVPISSLVAKR